MEQTKGTSTPWEDLGSQRHTAEQIWYIFIRESPPQFGNRIMARVYVRGIARRTMYQKALNC